MLCSLIAVGSIICVVVAQGKCEEFQRLIFLWRLIPVLNGTPLGREQWNAKHEMLKHAVAKYY